MVVRNICEFPVKILVKGQEIIIPYDGRFYNVDDSAYDAYKDLFQIAVMPVPQKQKTLVETKKAFNQPNSGVKILSKDTTKTSSEKIDFLYSFHFGFSNDIDKIVQRLRHSIQSIIKQNINVCVCNTSKTDIWHRIKDLGDINYINPKKGGKFCKAFTINYGVKNLVKTPYFILSDIDLIYPTTYIDSMMKYTNATQFFRVITYNHNIGYEFQSSNIADFEKYLNVADPIRTHYGLSPGNGLVHTKSFHLVNGFDEDFKGYGHEDSNFNERVRFINTYVEDENVALRTVHLFHPFIPGKSMERSLKMNDEKRHEIANAINGRKFDPMKDIDIIKANKNRKWGELK